MVTWHYLYCLFTYIYSLLIEKDFCEGQNLSVKFLCALLVYLCLSFGNLIFFLVTFSTFYCYFCVFRILTLSFSTGFFQNMKCEDGRNLILLEKNVWCTRTWTSELPYLAPSKPTTILDNIFFFLCQRCLFFAISSSMFLLLMKSVTWFFHDCCSLSPLLLPCSVYW